MPSRRIEDLVPELQKAWVESLAEYQKLFPHSPQPFITCTHRTEKEQAELYAQGRTKPGKIVTNLKKGSKHNSLPSQAFDIAFKNAAGALVWDKIHFKNFADVVKKLHPNVEWGGTWKKLPDAPHFQV
jgi:peptidoglycan LD-endopeptidase CwlK